MTLCHHTQDFRLSFPILFYYFYEPPSWNIAYPGICRCSVQSLLLSIHWLEIKKSTLISVKVIFSLHLFIIPGVGENGIEDIKAHSFFSSIEWEVCF